MADAFLSMLADDEGGTFVEYALMLSLVGVAAIVVMTSVGTRVTESFTAFVGTAVAPQ